MCYARRTTTMFGAFWLVLLANCVFLVWYSGLVTHKQVFNNVVANKQVNNNVLVKDVKERKLNKACTAGVSPYVNMTDVKRTNLSDLNEFEVKAFMDVHCWNTLKICENKTLVERLAVRTEVIKLKELYEMGLTFVKDGGWWSPEGCIAKQHTAIIIPFRNRHEHLPVLLRQLHPMLKRQQLHYRIFVVEQDDGDGFNRGKLMNIGYTEALKIFPYSCFVFHDVDHVPEDDRIMHTCTPSPKHLSAAESKFNYTLDYKDTYGGVTMFASKDFRNVNGFSNLFWSWGGEDENLLARVRINGMRLHRESMEIGVYRSLSHKDLSRGRNKTDIQKTWLTMEYAQKYHKVDGLNSLQYIVKGMNSHRLFTEIKVDLIRSKDKTFGLWDGAKLIKSFLDYFAGGQAF